MQSQIAKKYLTLALHQTDTDYCRRLSKSTNGALKIADTEVSENEEGEVGPG